MFIMCARVLTHARTHSEDTALQTYTTGQNSLQAAEIVQIRTCSQHPRRQGREEQVSYVLISLLQGYLMSMEVCEKQTGLTDAKASY